MPCGGEVHTGGPTRKVGGAETPHYAVIAQLVERLSCKQQVEGLSPSGGSKADDPLKYPAGAQAGVHGRHSPRASLSDAYHAGLFIGL